MDKINEYITGRINGLKAKQAATDSPISQDIIEGSSVLKLEQVRTNAQIEELEALLLVINIFTPKEKKLKKQEPRSSKAKKLSDGGSKQST